MPRILFICMGNICRSPLAEGILRRRAKEAGIEVEIDSAGTGDWHVGDTPDPRAVAEGRKRGCDMSMRARQLRASDFDEFDRIIVMDFQNLGAVSRWPGCRPEKVALARSFDPVADGEEVPDPYYGDPEDFVAVAEMLEGACAGIIDVLRTRRAA